MSEEHENAIMGFPLFQGYTRAGAQMILEGGEVGELSSGDVLFSEGDPAESAALVLTGKLEVFVERDGQDLVLNAVEPGNFLGELALLCGQPRSASVRAVEASAILKFSASGFRSLLLSDITLSQRIFSQALRTLVEKEQALIAELMNR